MSVPRILIVAGSDSGGGAGLQADVKTVTMLGGHAMTAVTAITAQNTIGVQAIHPVPAEMVVAQMRSCLDDIGVDAIKIGMLPNEECVRQVAGYLVAHPDVAARRGGSKVPIVLDPVLVATSGDVLSDKAVASAIYHRLMPIASLCTPNAPEALALGAFGSLQDRGGDLLMKGGHLEGDEIIDFLRYRNGEERFYRSSRIDTRHTHGTGCTLASAIAVGLARGLPLSTAVDRARAFVRVALHAAPGLGGGHGPMGHADVRLDGTLPGAMLNQLTLPMTDPTATRDFYRLLGLRLIVDAEPRYARFETAGGATLSIEAAHELDGKPLTFFECDDLVAVVGRLRAAGIAVGEPRVESWGWREARLADPFGNALCLYQAGEMRRFPPWRVGASLGKVGSGFPPEVATTESADA